jgi:glycosyltransferase involved in cell wall biosynthesis
VNVGFSLLTLFPGRVGGSETYVRGLLDEYVRGNGPAHVTVLANRHVEQAYRARTGGPVALHRVRSYRAGDRDLTRALAMAGARLAPALAERDVPDELDVLHLPVTVPIPRQRGATVVTIHEVQVHSHPEFFSAAERRYRRWAYDQAARDATLVVAVSGYVRDRLVEAVGVQRERIEVAHLGIDHDRFRAGPVEQDAARLAGLPLPERFVVYPANAWPHKNHRLLIEAMARVGDDLGLVLVGQDYGRRGELDEHARRTGAGPRVVQLGHVDADTVAALYRRARALVYPSLHEGFGAPPLEAMACGCAVASALNTSLVEVCGDAALELDTRDAAAMAAAIERVDQDESLRARLVTAGTARAREFSWRAAAERHRAIYERASETSPPPTRSL